MIKIKNLDSKVVKIDKTQNIFTTLDIKKVGDYENIHSVNPLYFIIAEVDGYIEEKNT